MRAGAPLTDAEGRALGQVTSGGFGPTVGGPVAMGYVTTTHAVIDHQVFAQVRGKALPCRVSALPFVPQNYYRGPAAPIARLDHDHSTFQRNHEWVAVDGDTGTVGITHHAQEQLGDIVFVDARDRPPIGPGRGMRGG